MDVNRERVEHLREQGISAAIDKASCIAVIVRSPFEARRMADYLCGEMPTLKNIL